MHTILGSSGIIGVELAKTLAGMQQKIRLVSRNPRKVNPTDETFGADLLDPSWTQEAVRGSEVAYLTAGLQYDITVWRDQWPRVMDNVIEACKRAGCRLVFFDNVYAYGKVNGWMTEETAMNPSSRKGEVRLKIAGMLLDEVQRGNLKALIARAADFYGPGAHATFVHVLVFERLRQSKRPQWLVNDKVRHSFTYTPDAGRGTALLGTTESAFGQVWHLPTAREPLTGEQFIELAARTFGRDKRHSVVSPWMLRLAGFYTPYVKESMEMLYQYDSDYLFDSSKFEHRFGFTPTPYRSGIVETATERN